MLEEQLESQSCQKYSPTALGETVREFYMSEYNVSNSLNKDKKQIN
jgi:hypothetical protein